MLQDRPGLLSVCGSLLVGRATLTTVAVVSAPALPASHALHPLPYAGPIALCTVLLPWAVHNWWGRGASGDTEPYDY